MKFPDIAPRFISMGGNPKDVRDTLRALRRAARRALELGIRTGTPVWVIKDHRIIDLTKESRAVVRKPSKRRARKLAAILTHDQGYSTLNF